MSKHSIDYQQLDNCINKKSYRLSEVQNQIEKVAFDIVRFKDPDKVADLWQIQHSDDGDYIVSMYEDTNNETIKTASLKQTWEVVSNNAKIHFFYKGDPIAKVACEHFGISPQQAKLLEKSLPNKLAEDKKLVSLLLGQVEESAKQQIINKYPELG